MEPKPDPSIDTPRPRGARSPAAVLSRAARVVARAAVWGVLAPPRAGLRLWSRLRPPQQLVLGFLSYVLVGTLLLCLPVARVGGAGSVLDHLFSSVSAVSTTGLTTLTVGQDYSRFGQSVLLVLFQLGGIGYMTLSSIVILARGGSLSPGRLGVLRAGYALPRYFVLPHFVVHVVVFTFVVELVGAAVLWWRFATLGEDAPLWSAIFHSVSAFSTAGFGLHPDSLERYAGDEIVTWTVGVLCYFGGIGFIVAQDVWYTLRLREQMITFTSRVILAATLGVFVVGVPAFWIAEPTLREAPLWSGIGRAAFQVMSASSTAGFNSIPIGPLGLPALVLLTGAMLIGASPSGTGGGLKTTTCSALLANALSVLRARERTILLGHEIPLPRVLAASATGLVYVVSLALGVFALSLVEPASLSAMFFEAASALGTVGLSTGITPSLTPLGKVIIIVLMFVGRCGPLTLGLAMIAPTASRASPRADDLAI